MKYYDTNTNGFYEEIAENRIEISDEYWAELLEKQSHGGRIQAINNEVVCVFPTEDEILTQETARQKVSLQTQINELDLKSIRALREGSIKDETTGQTWIEYYTEKIIEIRQQISQLG